MPVPPVDAPHELSGIAVGFLDDLGDLALGQFRKDRLRKHLAGYTDELLAHRHLLLESERVYFRERLESRFTDRKPVVHFALDHGCQDMHSWKVFPRRVRQVPPCERLILPH